MTIKKTLLTILLGSLGTMVLVAPVWAVTDVSFTPINVNVRQGQTFTLVLGLNPQGMKNYTAKVELRYPAGLLEAKSFTFANGWLPLSQPGYDLTDNQNGTLVKTAGYPGGISSPTPFGTVVFLAKRNGNGVIALSNNSFALDANNQNVIATAPVRTVVAVAALPVPATPRVPSPSTTPAPRTATSEPTAEPVAVTEEAPLAVGESVAVPSPIASRSLSASIGNILSLGTGSAIVGIVVVLIIGYAIYTLIRKRKNKNL